MATEHEKPSIAVPRIHPDGTPFRDLLNQIGNAVDAGDRFRWTLNRMKPQGPDYYPQHPGALTQAQDEHLARLKKLDEIMDELGAMLRGIIDQRGD